MEFEKQRGGLEIDGSADNLPLNLIGGKHHRIDFGSAIINNYLSLCFRTSESLNIKERACSLDPVVMNKFIADHFEPRCPDCAWRLAKRKISVV